ncbi:hypothetical protein [Enhygromyxa salina]|uniref:HEPN AbiU2-like domain-containing protein n=1 Tax=Enhygromyxa salina TaxID=215803 RepID=A0A2S9Y0B2_9BACT|nr:hypothetical protein [Enhygromyxa salina]PRP98545.1 hypothetical protein ENSA7_64880 [Enhygromyxa salina]
MLSPEREALIANELRVGKVIDATIETCRMESARAARLGSDDIVRIHNLAIYVCLSERDQGLLKIEALRADESDHARLSLVARQWATLLYEVAGDIRQKAFTMPIRETILAIDPGAQFELNEINSLAQQFWHRRGQELKRWRNAACAHRDFDALLQLHVVQEIDLLAVMDIAGEFADVPRRVVPFLTNVLAKTVGLDGALRVLGRASRLGGVET